MTKFFSILVVMFVFSVSSPAAQAKIVTLQHDDGSQEGKRSMTGGGHAVRFECPDDKTWYLKAVSVHGSRYGTAKAPNEDFQVVVASDDFKQRREIYRPYKLFKRGDEKWTRFGVDPVAVKGAFYVGVFFNPTRTKGVYVGIDADSSPTHSVSLSVSEPDKKQSDLEGDWMIRAYLTDEDDGQAQPLLGETERAEQMKADEAAYDKERLGDTRSLTLSHDSGEMSDYMNIQGAMYTVEFETPKNVEAYVWQVQVYASQFGGQHDSEAVSGDVYVLDGERKILSRSTFPYSVSTQQKQWISIPTLPTKVQGKFYVSLDTHGTSHKGLYLGYQKGNTDGHASTDERQDDHIKSADWSKKFADKQWMIRAKVADRPVVY